MQIINDPNAHAEELIKATEIVNNLASLNNDTTMQLVEMKVISAMIHLCKTSQDTNVLENSIWTLGNIAGEGGFLRDLVIEAGVVDVIISLLKQHNLLSLLRICVWTASNLPRRHGWSDDLLRLVPEMAKLLYSIDAKLLVDALWTLAQLSDGHDSHQSRLAEEPGLVTAVIRQLSLNRMVTLIPALRTVGNLLSGKDHVVDKLLSANVLDHLIPLLTHTRLGSRKEAAWSLSNIFSGNPAQIRSAILAGALPPLLANIYADVDRDVVKESLWCIGNMLTGCSAKDFPLIIGNLHVVHAIRTLISHNDTQLAECGITGVHRLIKWFEKHHIGLDDANPFVDAIANLEVQIQNHRPFVDAVALCETYLNGPRNPSHNWQQQEDVFL